MKCLDIMIIKKIYELIKYIKTYKYIMTIYIYIYNGDSKIECNNEF